MLLAGCGEDEHAKHRDGRLGEGGQSLHETSSKAKALIELQKVKLECCRHLNIVNLMGVCLPTEADMHPLLLLELCEVTSTQTICQITLRLIPIVKSIKLMLNTLITPIHKS